MKASIGRIIHVVTVAGDQSKTLPAIVVGTHDDDHVDAQMFSDRHAGHTFMSRVRHESSGQANPTLDVFWIWPPRET